MQVILLERVARLGQMGDVVKVRDGFGRNFLLPQGKALRATDANIKAFEARRVQLEMANIESRKEAQAAAEKLDGQRFVLIRSAS
ncbi:MAG: 50S ribosomal protein L9, partial [Rhodobacteraceae bacterium]|nr:50S ribosomal protein L9 [Paracoccaceae bacterium]